MTERVMMNDIRFQLDLPPIMRDPIEMKGPITRGEGLEETAATDELYVTNTGQFGQYTADYNALINMKRLILKRESETALDEPVTDGLQYLLTKKRIPMKMYGTKFTATDVAAYANLLIFAGITNPTNSQKRSSRWKLILQYGNIQSGSGNAAVMYTDVDDLVAQLKRNLGAWFGGNHGDLLHDKILTTMQVLLENGAMLKDAYEAMRAKFGL
jgi:hypothetical protein